MKVKYKISDIFDLQMGKTPSRDEQSFWNSNDYKWVAISDFDDCKYIENTSEYISSQAVKKTGIKIVPKNTVIMSFKLSIGKVAITKEDMYTNEAIMAFFNKGVVNIELSYLYYLLKSYKWDLLAQRAAKGKSLNKEILNNATLWFHNNIQTQKEIVAVLDKVTSLISKRKKQLEKLDILVKSKFIEMFGDPVLNPKGWEKKKLGEVYTIISGTTPDTNEQKYWNGTNLWVTPAELNNEIYINTTARKITDEAIKAKSLKVIPKFSVLLSSRAPIGKLAINTADMYCNQGFKCFINSKVLHSIYTYFYLLHRVEYIQSLGRGATFKEVSKEIVANIEIQVPPLDLQNQFAEFVEQVEKNKENIKSSLNQLETLYNALMQEYFG